MRPPLYIPAPAITRHAPRTSLIARDSSAVGVGFIVFRSGAQRAIANECLHLVVEKLHVLDVNVRCFDSHWAVEKNRKRLYFSGAKHFPEQQCDQLRAA